jgi:hypothetical protein
MRDFKFKVIVPNDHAPVQIVQMHDGDQPMFDTIRVNFALAKLGLEEDPFFIVDPITRKPVPRGDYSMIAGYDNQLHVRFRTLGHANQFKNLMGI